MSLSKDTTPFNKLYQIKPTLKENQIIAKANETNLTRLRIAHAKPIQSFIQKQDQLWNGLSLVWFGLFGFMAYQPL